jgi:scyllo-inositol 2-dehydrogenase (NADP+)
LVTGTVSGLRVGLAGFGLGGRAFHAPFITTNPRLQLTHVLQRRGDDAAELYPGVRVVREFEELLDPGAGIQLVVIATPNPTHGPFALRALESRKHVVVDKPFAVSADEARNVIDASRRVNRIVAPYQNRRWDGDFLTVRALLERGWLGDVEGFESRLDRWRPEIPAGRWKEEPAAGSGLLFDLGPHLIDQCLALFGAPDSIGAQMAAERPGSRVDDRFELALEYANFTAKLGARLMAKDADARFRMTGSHGHYVKRGVDPQEAPLRRGERPQGPDWGVEPPADWGALVATIDSLRVEGVVRTLRGDYGGFYDNLCDTIEGTATLAVSPEDAVKTLRIIELAIESDRRNGEPVPVTF